MENRNAMDSVRWGKLIQVAGAICLVLAVTHSGRVVGESMFAGPVGMDGWWGYVNACLIGLAMAMPYLCLLSGLVAMMRLGKRYQTGEIISSGNVRLISTFGASLSWAAAAFLLIRPTILDWVGGVSRGIEIRIDEAGIAMATAGVFLMAMAHVMNGALRLQEENESFI